MDFRYFLYYLRSRKNALNNTKKFNKKIFLSDIMLMNQFDFFKEIESDDEVCTLSEKPRNFGKTTSLLLYSFFLCSTERKKIYFIVHSGMFKYCLEVLNEFNEMFGTVLPKKIKINTSKREVFFEETNSVIKFFSDTTYEFRNIRDIDIMIFDCKIKNKEKFDGVCENRIATGTKKIIRIQE